MEQSKIDTIDDRDQLTSEAEIEAFDKFLEEEMIPFVDGIAEAESKKDYTKQYLPNDLPTDKENQDQDAAKAIAKHMGKKAEKMLGNNKCSAHIYKIMLSFCTLIMTPKQPVSKLEEIQAARKKVFKLGVGNSPDLRSVETTMKTTMEHLRAVMEPKIQMPVDKDNLESFKLVRVRKAILTLEKLDNAMQRTLGHGPKTKSRIYRPAVGEAKRGGNVGMTT